MFKRILAEVLADEYCSGRGWTEARALELGRQILRGNVESILKSRKSGDQSEEGWFRSDGVGWLVRSCFSE
jgi:ATP-dependent RNA circularization protein (DNA/RNA ligase family)